MSVAAVRSQSTSPSSETQRVPERFERQAGRSRTDPPTGNVWRCYWKICKLYEDGNRYVFAKSGNAMGQSAYDFAAGAANYTKSAIRDVLSSPYGGAAALDYFAGNNTATSHNHTGASPGLTNVSASASGPGSTGLSPAQLAALFGGVAIVPAVAYGLYHGYGYMTRQPSPQVPPIPEAVPLNPMPTPRF
jgi:hypothetical protein